MKRKHHPLIIIFLFAILGSSCKKEKGPTLRAGLFDELPIQFVTQTQFSGSTAKIALHDKNKIDLIFSIQAGTYPISSFHSLTVEIVNPDIQICATDYIDSTFADSLV